VKFLTLLHIGENMKIGELAKRVDLNVETLRYYERLGLLENPKRTPSGYRDYDTSAIKQIYFIQSSQQLGFSLTEIKQLISIKANGQLQASSDIKNKVSGLNNKLQELNIFKQSLEALVNQEDASAG